MNQSEAKQFAKLLEAWGNGGELEYSSRPGRWTVISNPTFSGDPISSYRIKPKQVCPFAVGQWVRAGDDAFFPRTIVGEVKRVGDDWFEMSDVTGPWPVNRIVAPYWGSCVRVPAKPNAEWLAKHPNVQLTNRLVHDAEGARVVSYTRGTWISEDASYPTTISDKSHRDLWYWEWEEVKPKYRAFTSAEAKELIGANVTAGTNEVLVIDVGTKGLYAGTVYYSFAEALERLTLGGKPFGMKQ